MNYSSYNNKSAGYTYNKTYMVKSVPSRKKCPNLVEHLSRVIDSVMNLFFYIRHRYLNREEKKPKIGK